MCVQNESSPLDDRHIGATLIKAFREHGQIKLDTIGIIFIILAVRHLNYIVTSRLCFAKQFRRINLDIFCTFNHRYN